MNEEKVSRGMKSDERRRLGLKKVNLSSSFGLLPVKCKADREDARRAGAGAAADVSKAGSESGCVDAETGRKRMRRRDFGWDPSFQM